MIKKPQPRKIDPEKVAYQLDKLVAAIWGVAEDEIAEEIKTAKASKLHGLGNMNKSSNC